MWKKVQSDKKVNFFLLKFSEIQIGFLKYMDKSTIIDW
ncbi:hypothetical protein bmyco0002_5860 [Bacillus pseudomycoides]|nr:hypothetical protein bmyco0002_5860 [Bacillus pseudomycoides]